MALVRDRNFGQLDAGPSTAATALDGPDSPSLLPYYLMAVAAGVTVYLITKWIGGRK